MLSPAKITFPLLLLAAPLSAQTEWSTYFGQGGRDALLGMKTDAAGRVWFCGETDATTFVSPGAFQPTVAGGIDAYVACLDPSLPPAQQLVWCTHLGGSGDDSATELHVDPSGTRVTVVGSTSSADFPVTSGSVYAGGEDAFVVTLDPTAVGANQLLWSTLIGGAGEDLASDVDVWNGEVGVVGTTESTNLPTLQAHQSTFGGVRDLFVARFDSSGSPMFTTYLGGSRREGVDVWAAMTSFHRKRAVIGFDTLGRAAVCSTTISTDHPNPSGALQGSRLLYDLALTRWNQSGQLIDSGIVGGSDNEWIFDLRCDGTDRVLLGGGTRSPDFPVTANALQGYRGDVDGLLFDYDFARDQITYSTHLGATGQDNVMSAHRESNGDLLIALHSQSSNLSATPGAPQAALTGPGQPYLMRVRPGTRSSELIYASWFGGTLGQMVLALEPDGRGGVVVGGPTRSMDHPTTSNAFDSSYTGTREAWITNHRMLPDGVTRFGDASTPCGPATYLQMNSAPLPGNANWAIEPHNAPASSLGVVLLGLPNPSGLNLFGADLFVSLPVLADIATSSDGKGFSSVPMPLPQGFQWTGNLALQSVWLNTAACGGSSLSATNAIR